MVYALYVEFIYFVENSSYPAMSDTNNITMRRAYLEHHGMNAVSYITESRRSSNKVAR